jgi:hypothetical protein
MKYCGDFTQIDRFGTKSLRLSLCFLRLALFLGKALRATEYLSIPQTKPHKKIYIYQNKERGIFRPSLKYSPFP